MVSIAPTGTISSTKRFALADTPDVAKPYTSITIRPNYAVVTLADGKAQHVELRGPWVLSGGDLSTKSESDVSFWAPAEWPEFVQEIAREAEKA